MRGVGDRGSGGGTAAAGQQSGAGWLPRLRLGIGGQRENEVRSPTLGARQGLGQLQSAAGKTLAARAVEVVGLMSRLGLRAEQPFRGSQPVRHTEILIGEGGDVRRGGRSWPIYQRAVHSSNYGSPPGVGQPAGRTAG
jgi:hypothetical protein